MAYKQVGVTKGGNIKDFEGLSTDTKPTTDIGYGSTFFEVDTGKIWYFSNNTNTVTSNGWWEV